MSDVPIPRDDSNETAPVSSTAAGWASQQVAAMVDAWAVGDHVTADDLLAGHPGIDTESALRLIFEEVCLRRDAGLEVDTTDVVGRYPQWGSELRALFDCERLLRPSGPVVALPEIGETLGPFLLRGELGRGASGRTFLATETTLANRPVVVKVVRGDQVEHLALASLRHTHIVPLFSLQTFPERGLLGLCMPYLGGASLAGIFDDLADLPVSGRSGRLLVELIDRATPSSAAAPRVEGPFRRGLEGASYVQAVTWIASCLADALHYAHARGLVHMDVKPSNVLITADGQPMLLDFHLARAPIRSGERVAGRLGGTPGWMSPEQEAALAAVAWGQPVPAAVDGRSDLFALGLLLRQALYGSRTRSERERERPVGVGLGLADTIRKCLDPDPGRRYPDAAALADDLRRDLDNRPLRGVRNRDLLERLQKVQRRHPALLAWGLTGLLIAGATVAAALGARAAYRQRVDGLASALAVGRAARAAGRFDEAIGSLRRGLERAGPAPGAGGLRGELEAELRRAERGRQADELHHLANRVRFHYGIALPPPAEGRALEALCRELWDRRRVLIDADGHPLDPAVEQRIHTDLLELATVVADLCVGLAAPNEADEAKRKALGWLDQVEAELGPSLALEARRCRWGRGPAGERPLPRASSVWEHYDLGRFLLRDGRTAAAAEVLRRAVALCPEDFWSNFYEGLCDYGVGRFEPAAAAFRTCVALEPGSAVCRYNRALALEALGRLDEAEAEYTQAVERDPGLAVALLNRGILAYKAGRTRQALADFARALNGRSDRATRARIHYNLALAQIASGDRTSAFRNVERASLLGCPEARTLSARLR